MTRVLLVDDARLMAELEGTALGRSSFELVPVRAGQDIVALATRLRPDVILLRNGESFPDALEACRALEAEPATRGIPVVYIGLGLHRQRYLAAGVKVFIPRPVTRHELQEAMRHVLALRDRVALRRSVRLAVRLVLADQVVEGRSVNLSITGALLDLRRRVEPGERGTLCFTAAGRQVELSTEVVRCGPGPGLDKGVGVRFVNIDAHTAAWLSRFVRTEGERRAAVAGGEPAR
ncbi:MAG: PilZ domain-containing protein [Acidobacteriota bacterium]|nr:PilZ domain-containing protein [Acidobacteriota bacterium]MDQ7088865.1 PilZ domain-containing protein [Acidobacteriota bacterium]